MRLHYLKPLIILTSSHSVKPSINFIIIGEKEIYSCFGEKVS